MANCKVAQAVLCTLSAYVDWISMTYIVDNSGLLLQMLCAMLHDNFLQLPAAECLLTITNRKVAFTLVQDSLMREYCKKLVQCNMY